MKPRSPARSPFDLHGQVALVTASARGLGKASALALAQSLNRGLCASVVSSLSFRGQVGQASSNRRIVTSWPTW